MCAVGSTGMHRLAAGARGRTRTASARPSATGGDRHAGSSSCRASATRRQKGWRRTGRRSSRRCSRASGRSSATFPPSSPRSATSTAPGHKYAQLVQQQQQLAATAEHERRSSSRRPTCRSTATASTSRSPAYKDIGTRFASNWLLLTGGPYGAFQPPVAPLYVPPNRASGVRARISRSTVGERCSTYQTSSSIRSSHGSAARPWICAQPVMPGLDLEPAPLPRRVPLDLVAKRRPRADHAHVAADDVPELRQLVDREPAQDPAGARDPRVAPVDRVTGADLLGADDHRPHLQQLELARRPCPRGVCR